MATHDYVIDNQSAPSFRSDLNSALQAIVTQNSNATAPTTTYANMVWYDTANNQLKKRNEANSDWITLGTIDETAGTFTPSGERALATQAQAEAGTDNATLMTPLRTAQAIATSSQTPTYSAGSVVLDSFIDPTYLKTISTGNLSGYDSATVVNDVQVVVNCSGTLRISADVRVKVTTIGGSSFMEVAKNGTLQGSRQSTSSTSFQTYTQDVSVVAGDILSLRVGVSATAGSSGGSMSGEFRNWQVKANQIGSYRT